MADLLAEIVEMDSTVSSNRFINAFGNLEHVLSESFVNPVPAVATRLGILERATARHLAFILEKSPELERIRTRSHELFMGVLMELGIDDPEMFEKISPTIDQISPIWLPHVTVREESSAVVRPKYMSRPVKFVLTPPTLRL